MLHDIVAPKQYHQIFQKAFRHFQINGTGDAVGKTLELPALRKDGTTFQVDLSMSAVNIGGKWHALGIIREGMDEYLSKPVKPEDLESMLSRFKF
jgi:hypothetical protein